MKKRYTLTKWVRLTQLLLLISVVLWITSSNQKTTLPDYTEIKPELQNEPVQELFESTPYNFEYSGKSYVVHPVARYEIHGLVVSHNDIHSLFDMYHDSSSVDIKDLCVIWGSNLESNNFKKAQYWSEPWTCWFKFDDRADYRKFDQHQLSNTHIISHKPEVRKKIMRSGIGDQIYMSGYLVNYAPAETPALLRTSSLTREDTGNGACEVMLVDHFQTIKKNRPGWNRLHKLSRTATILLFPLLIFLVIRSAYRDAYGS